MENCGGRIIKAYGTKESQQRYLKAHESVENDDLRMHSWWVPFGNVDFEMVKTHPLMHS